MAAAVTTLLSHESDSETDEETKPAFPRHKETCITLAIKAAVSQEDELYGYLRHIYTVFRQSSLAVIVRTIITLIAVVIFTIGLIRFRKCSYEPEIPLFLVLEGAIIILKTCIVCIKSCQSRPTAEGERNTLDTCNDISSLFLVLWGLTGSVWVFGSYKQVNVDNPDIYLYCDKLVYMCSLWFLLSMYCCIIIIALLLFTLSIYYLVKTDGSKRQLPYDIRV